MPNVRGAPSPVSLADGVPSFDIATDGSPIAEDAQIVSIDVWSGVGEVARARIVLPDGDPASGTFPQARQYLPGRPITIALGYAGATLETVFVGSVVRMSVVGSVAEPSRLIVEATGNGAPAAPPTAMPVLLLTFGDSILAFDLADDAALPDARAGFVSFQGSTRAVPGCTVTLAGLGTFYDGDNIVSRVHHRLAEGLWTTKAGFGPAPVGATVG